MSDGQVRELAQSEKTQGKINAFRQLAEKMSKKQEAIPSRLARLEGEYKAYLGMAEVIQAQITSRIHKLSALDVDRDQIKDEQEWALSLKTACQKAARECSSERLRVEGEARVLLSEVELIGDLSKKAIADERTLDALESGQDAFRQQSEDTKPKAKPKAKRKPAKKRAKSTKPKKDSDGSKG